MTIICPDVQASNLRQLAAAVVTRALEEAKQSKQPNQTDALVWLTSEDASYWMDWAGLQHDNALDILTSGKLKRTRIKSKGKTNG